MRGKKKLSFARAALPSVPGLWIDEEEKALVEFIMLSTDGKNSSVVSNPRTLLPLLLHRDVEFLNEQVS